MVSKITSPVSPLDVITKINSIIDDKQDKLTSGTNIKTVNSTSLLGSGNISIPTLPSQSGNSGKYLTTNGSTASWAKVQTGGNRNVGEIISSSLPLTDAGLHLLDGSLILGGGIYSEFVDYIADLYGDGTNIPSYFCTESEWQTSVTTYGVCGKFVYDSTNNTVRLPKVTGIVEGTTDINALGDLVQAGLPNITGDGTAFTSFVGTSGAVYTNSRYTQWAYGGGGSYGQNTWAFDASRSSSIYGNSSTVQPQTIKAFYYIVIANSTKTDIQVDIDEIAADLNDKVNKSDLQEVQCVVETYVNGTSWYRVYSDGWCEQGGRAALNETSTTTVTLLKAYADMNYSVSAVSITASTASDTEAGLQCTPITASQITLTCHYINPNNQTACWQAYGYIEV